MHYGILFDWGGTLAERMPRHTAQGWSVEPAMPGALETLRFCKSKGWTTALASNADYHTEADVHAALRPQGISPLLDRVFTSYLINAAKPWPQFFNTILQELALPPEQVLMVGDSYTPDIWGALQVGIAAIWVTNSAEGHPLPANARAIPNLELFEKTAAELGFK